MYISSALLALFGAGAFAIPYSPSGYVSPSDYASPTGYPTASGYPTPSGHSSKACPAPVSTPKPCPNATYPDFCLTSAQADAAADIFRRLIQDYSVDLALEALTEDFVDWTSAVNIIRNRGNEGPFVVNAVSFDGRDQFMAAQGSQPKIPFETLNTWYGCDAVTTRWQTPRSANGQATEANDIPVVGIAVLKVVPDAENSYGFRVKELYSEFNAAAWLVNLGVFKPTPVASPNATATGAQKREVLPWVGMI